MYSVPPTHHGSCPETKGMCVCVCVCVCDAQIFQIMLKLRGSIMMRRNHVFFCPSALSPVRVCVCVCLTHFLWFVSSTLLHHYSISCLLRGKYDPGHVAMLCLSAFRTQDCQGSVACRCNGC